jgi:carboxylesterase type B
MGQSAGAASILHHITASAGAEDRPVFNKAILESPGFFPQPDGAKDDATYEEFLNRTGAQNLAELRDKPTDATILMSANDEMTFRSPYGYFRFGPTIDGSYVPNLPGILLQNREFHSMPLLLGYTKLDGLLFTPPWIRSNDDLEDHVIKLFPSIEDRLDVLQKLGDDYKITEPNNKAKDQLRQVADFFDVRLRRLSSNSRAVVQANCL